jgi:hypothetical protein
MILRYLILATLQVILMAFQWIFSFLIALSVTRDGHLRFFPSIFEPTDSLAIGDRMYWDNEMAYTKNWPFWIRQYWLALNWGMRNPAYGFANLASFTIKECFTFTTTCKELPDIDLGEGGAVIGEVTRSIVNGDGKKYFEYRSIKMYSKTNCYYIQVGWSIPFDGGKVGDKCHLCVYFRQARIK